MAFAQPKARRTNSNQRERERERQTTRLDGSSHSSISANHSAADWSVVFPGRSAHLQNSPRLGRTEERDQGEFNGKGEKGVLLETAAT